MINRILFSIIILSNLMGQQDTVSAAPNSPYYLSKRMDLPLAAVSAGLLLGAELVNVTPLTEEDIDDLDKDVVSDFDYSATENWDTISVATSDLLLYSSIGFPQTGTRHLGVKSVRGCSLVPIPAANMIAFMTLLHLHGYSNGPHPPRNIFPDHAALLATLRFLPRCGKLFEQNIHPSLLCRRNY